MISQQQLKAFLQEREIGVNAPEVLIELPEGPIFHVLIEGRWQALHQWQRACDLVAVTGLWPMIVNSREVATTSLLFEQIQTGVAATEFLHQARAMNALHLLAKRLRRCLPIEEPEKLPEEVPMEVFCAPEPGRYLPQIEEIMGTWPDLFDPESYDPEDFLKPSERLEVPKGQKTVSLCFFPVEQSWQVPALLRYGGWNVCPLPVEHSSIHLSWHKRYGAEIVCLSGDTIECFVPHPPTTQQECRKLALEHFAYCSDIVRQEHGSLEALATDLLRNRIWYFWWD